MAEVRTVCSRARVTTAKFKFVKSTVRSVRFNRVVLRPTRATQLTTSAIPLPPCQRATIAASRKRGSDATGEIHAAWPVASRFARFAITPPPPMAVTQRLPSIMAPSTRNCWSTDPTLKSPDQLLARRRQSQALISIKSGDHRPTTFWILSTNALTTRFHCDDFFFSVFLLHLLS